MKAAFARALAHKSVRSSAGNGLRASGTARTSGYTASDNFGGASQASAEILEGMDSVFRDIVVADDARGIMNAQIQRLDDRASQYKNSSLDFCTSRELWLCDKQKASLIALAWACAANVYDHGTESKQDLEHAGAKLTVTWSLPASSLGTVKATTLTTYTPVLEASATSAPANYLIIAIKGSATKLDHVVNLNGEPREAGALFLDDSMRISAHAGFLNSALELLLVLSEQIEQIARHNPSTKLIFTGHSAGGATATLLYLAFRSRMAATYPDMDFSCITFGCPPVARALFQRDENALNRMTFRDDIINIMNEYDLITRADGAYLRSLIPLYQQVDGMPTTEIWELPSPELQHVGAIIVLRTEITPFEDGDGEGDWQGNTDPSVSAWKLTQEDLAKVMFCRLSVHGRVAYQDRIAQIEKGAFNGHNGWV